VVLAGCATALLIYQPQHSTLPLLMPVIAVILVLTSLALLWRGLLASEN
jgi:hypothetical protein